MRIKYLILWALLSTFALSSFAESWTWTFTPGNLTFTAVKNISRADSTLMQSFSGGVSSHGVTFMIHTPGGTLSSNAQKQFLQFTAPYTP